MKGNHTKPQTVTRKGQVTIPKKIRDYLQIAADSRVEFVVCEQGVLLKAAPATVLSYRGFLKIEGKAFAADIDQAIEQATREEMLAKEGRPRAQRPRRRS